MTFIVCFAWKQSLQLASLWAKSQRQKMKTKTEKKQPWLKRCNGHQNKIWQRFNINSLWLDPSELIYNTVSEHTFLRFIVRTFARRKLCLVLYLFGIFTGFPLDLICMWISRFLCSSRWFACLFYFLSAPSRRNLCPIPLGEERKNVVRCGRYSELWQIEKIISFDRIERRKRWNVSGEVECLMTISFHHPDYIFFYCAHNFATYDCSITILKSTFSVAKTFLKIN